MAYAFPLVGNTSIKLGQNGMHPLHHKSNSFRDAKSVCQMANSQRYRHVENKNFNPIIAKFQLEKTKKYTFSICV